MILIVDFGSQTAHLIGRRLRQLGVETMYADPKSALSTAKEIHPKGIIFSGGPSSVYGQDAPTVEPEIFDLSIPVLGICYGWQLMAHLLGGEVKNTTKEYGPELLRLSLTTCAETIFSLPEKKFSVIMSHGDSVVRMPPGFTAIGSSKTVPFSAVANCEKKLFGVQFHPEADHTTYGMDILKNFAATVCKEPLNPLALDPKIIIETIRKTAGSQKVICAVSGGIDSTVTAYLIAKAIGKNIHPIYVDSGLMRPGTDKRLKDIFSKHIDAHLLVVDAKNEFLTALRGITDPEMKRKTIGKLYIDIFSREAKKHSDATILAQGTIYSDVIESKGSTHASNIKSHHNVGGLPDDLSLQLLEPVRNFYKDEVRQIGKLVGLPDDIVNQQPFPGPGYAVRIRGEVTEKRLQQVQIADGIVMEEIQNAGLKDSVFQCFALMSGAYSTAVKGDERVFAEVVAIRAYESKDIMTSRWARIPYEVLEKISTRIVNEVPDVSRVVYDITSKPPATMEWE